MNLPGAVTRPFSSFHKSTQKLRVIMIQQSFHFLSFLGHFFRIQLTFPRNVPQYTTSCAGRLREPPLVQGSDAICLWTQTQPSDVPLRRGFGRLRQDSAIPRSTLGARPCFSEPLFRFPYYVLMFALSMITVVHTDLEGNSPGGIPSVH